MDKDRPPRKMEIEDVRKDRRRYRLNKRKFATVMSVFCFIAAALIVTFYIITNSDTKAALSETASLQSTSQLGSTKTDLENYSLEGKLIVIDAGHGGADCGAIGVSGVYEADLNLKMAKLLKAELETAGAKIIMTRSDENALADEKMADMEERRRIIEDSGSDIVVSVHMNSYTDSSISGPVVLFMEGSEFGEKLAKAIEQSLNDRLDPPSEKSARAEADMYILKSGNQPCVIMECGYLSNEEEEAKLVTEEYQEKIAQAACEGIRRYFSELEEKS